MLLHVLSGVSALLTLAYAARSDWKHEQFNAVPVLIGIFLTIIFNLNFPGTGFFLTNLVMGILIWQRMMRPGDILLTAAYSYVFSSTQGFFTFLTVTGMYLYTYPKIFNEKEWIPFAPAILTCFLLQSLLYIF